MQDNRVRDVIIMLTLIAFQVLLFCVTARGQNPNTAAFPTTVATDQNLTVAKTRSSSTLSGSINSSTLTVNVGSGVSFIQYEVISIDSEEMVICSIASNTLTICSGTRGLGDTAPASHTAGAAVRGVISSWHVNQPGAEIKAIQARLRDRMIQCQDNGSTDNYSCVPDPPITAYSAGQVATFKANTANTGAATINLGPGNKTIKKISGGITTDLSDNDIRAGQWVTLIYDGTNFQMQSQLGNETVTTSGTNIYTGYNDYSGATARLPETTVAGLPAASGVVGRVYRVTDAINGSCQNGGGGGSALCYSNGSTWQSFASWVQTLGNGLSVQYSPQPQLSISMQALGLDIRCVAASSSPTTYTCAPSLGLGGYSDGTLIVFDVGGTACTGGTATTLNISTVGAKRIYRHDGTTDPTSTDCTAGQNLLMVYDTALTSGAGGWRIIGGVPSSGGGGGTVDSVTCSDGVTCSPTTGAVLVSVTSDVVRTTGNNSPALGATGYTTITLPNAGTTGTTLNYTAINSAGTALIAGSSQASGVLGCVVAGAGTTGSATIAVSGNVPCTFSNSRTVGNWVVPSSTDGQVADAGATRPTSGQVLGTVKDTSGPGAGTVLWVNDNVAASGGSSATSYEFRVANYGGTIGMPGGLSMPTAPTGIGVTQHGLSPFNAIYFAKGSPTDTSKLLFTMRIPPTFGGTINLDVEVETSSGTGVMVAGVETVCLANGAAWTSPTFNSEQLLSTTSIAGTGNVYLTSWTLTSTGCDASELLWVRFRRVSTDAADTNSGDVVVGGWRFRLQ